MFLFLLFATYANAHVFHYPPKNKIINGEPYTSIHSLGSGYTDFYKLHCYDNIYNFSLDTTYVEYPTVRRVELEITKINGLDVDLKYEMKNQGNNIWDTQVSDFGYGDLIEYNFIKYTTN